MREATPIATRCAASGKEAGPRTAGWAVANWIPVLGVAGAGAPLGTLSGVLVGKGDLLYVGRNGNMTVDQVHKSDGTLIGSFAAPDFRVEDLECDLNSFAPLEAIWVKDAYNDHVAAYEVEEGTCQCGGGGGLPAVIDIKFCSNPNGFNCKSGGVMPMTVFGTDVLDVREIDLDTVQLCLADDDSVCIDAESLRNANYFDRGNPDNDGVPVVSAPLDDPGIDQVWRQK